MVWPTPPIPKAQTLTVSAKQFAIVLLGLICGLIFWGQDVRLGVRIRAFDMGLIAVAAESSGGTRWPGRLRHTAPFVLAFGAYAIYLACNALLQTSADTALKELVQMCSLGRSSWRWRSFSMTAGSMSVFLAVMLVTLWALALHNAYAHVSQGAFAGWKTLGDQKLTHSMIVLIMAVVTLSHVPAQGLVVAGAASGRGHRDAVPVGRAQGLGRGGVRHRGMALMISDRAGSASARCVGRGRGAGRCAAWSP
jgi:hypothetical protein